MPAVAPPDLDRRFRPRNWVVLAISPDAGPRRRVLNTATAACLSVNLPALSTHCHLGAVDGLLILFDRVTRAIRLLDPLSNAVTEFPAISPVVVNATTYMGVPLLHAPPEPRRPLRQRCVLG